MYKKASRLKLRFTTERGNLAVEQLWGFGMTNLRKLAKDVYAELKKFGEVEDELSFLEEGPKENNKEYELAKLRYEIIKDVIVTLNSETKEAVAATEKKAEIKKLEELLAKKREAKLENMSEEDLLKRIAELEGQA